MDSHIVITFIIYLLIDYIKKYIISHRILICKYLIYFTIKYIYIYIHAEIYSKEPSLIGIIYYLISSKNSNHLCIVN